MNPVAIIQHVACESAGTIERALGGVGLDFTYVRPFLGDAIPENTRSLGGLVVMGGPMGVYEMDRYPFLREEVRLLSEACEKRIPVLGVCLGSQLLAAALGARVRPNHSKEIGWHRVQLSPDAADDRLWRDLAAQFVPLHWHGDVFDLPAGAVNLAQSKMTPVQAFRFRDSAYGLLFHLETTAETLGGMVDSFGDELAAAGIDSSSLIEEASVRLSALLDIGPKVFRRWAELVLEFAESCKITSNARVHNGS